MFKRIALLAVALWPMAALGVTEGEHPPFWEEPKVNVGDQLSLQRGARLYANYCMGCHSAQYHRWMHVADDLGIPEDVVQENLIWTTDEDGQKDQVGTLMVNAMSEEYGEQIFGTSPPDLTLTTRLRGPGWVYNYLRSFYLDESSPTGVDNAVLHGASMPHVLGPLQGWQRPVYPEDEGEEGEIIDFEMAVEGDMTPHEYDRAVNDLVNFMVYLAEPARLDRTAVGGWVILFLLIFLVIAYLLKREYWKDVHDH